MSEQQIGALMLCGASLWLAGRVVLGLWRRQKAIEVGLLEIVLVVSFWVIGRAVAGKSVLELML
jgi:hypothetical protein